MLVVTYRDPRGRVWRLQDYRGAPPHRKAVELGHWTSEGRAFIAVDDSSNVRLYAFGLVAYRETDERILADQFKYSVPVAGRAVERMYRNG